MTTRRIVSVGADDDIALAVRLMRWARVRHLPVLRDGALVGVFTERDYLRYRAETGGTGALDPVDRFMSTPVTTVSPDDPATAASALMLSGHIGCLPVVDEGALVGLVTVNDLLAADVRAIAPRIELDGPVSRVMARNPVVVHPHLPLLDVVALMAEHGFRHIPVTDNDGRLVGIVSDRDVRTAIGDPDEALRREFTELEELTVSSVMTAPAESVADDASLATVADTLTRSGVGALPVVDRRGRVTGIVSYVDLVRALTDLARSNERSNS